MDPSPGPARRPAWPDGHADGHAAKLCWPTTEWSMPNYPWWAGPGAGLLGALHPPGCHLERTYPHQWGHDQIPIRVRDKRPGHRRCRDGPTMTSAAHPSQYVSDAPTGSSEVPRTHTPDCPEKTSASTWHAQHRTRHALPQLLAGRGFVLQHWTLLDQIYPGCIFRE